MFDRLRGDIARLKGPSSGPFYVLEAALFDNGFQAVVSHRLASFFKRNRVPFFGPFFARCGLFLTGVDISHSAEIGPGLRISHGVGIVIGGYAQLGPGALLLHGVTLGSLSESRVEQMPKVGANAFLGAGAKLIGGIEVGDDVVVGPNVVLTEDVPANSRVLVESRLRIESRGGNKKAETPDVP